MQTLEHIYCDGTYLQRNASWHAEDSPWKAGEIAALLERNGVRPRTVAEVGCGAGAVLGELARRYPETQFRGYDISRQAIELAAKGANERVRYFNADLFAATGAYRFDLLLAIDVFEHVPDYLGFLARCSEKARYKLYHIPLDLHVSALLRNGQVKARQALGHLHYFSDATALATLEDTGHEIVDTAYTAGCIELFRQHPSFGKALANAPRWIVARFSPGLAARLLGGFSLLVLCR